MQYDKVLICEVQRTTFHTSTNFKGSFQVILEAKGRFFWDYSSYSYSGKGITENTEFQFRKERFF